MENYEKKYKDALDKLRKLHADWSSTQNRAAKELEEVFDDLIESDDERIKNAIINILEEVENDETYCGTQHIREYVDWLKCKCSPNIGGWNNEDDTMIKETLYFINEYQRSNRCKDENGMQNSVSCEYWLSKLKNRFKK